MQECDKDLLEIEDFSFRIRAIRGMCSADFSGLLQADATIIRDICDKPEEFVFPFMKYVDADKV